MTFDLKIRGWLPYELLVEVPSAACRGRQLEQVSCLTTKAGLRHAESMSWSRVTSVVVLHAGRILFFVVRISMSMLRCSAVGGVR